MKTKFSTDNIGRVTMNCYGVERVFSTDGIEGGYVVELRNGQWKLVCDKLQFSGDTLYCDNRADLINVIRRERRAMRRADARAAAQVAA